jgi:hypothetical protein
METVLNLLRITQEESIGRGMTPSFALGGMRPLERSLDHAVNEFAQGVQLMANSETNADLGGLVKELVRAVHEEGQKQGRMRIHPLVYANLVFIGGLIFSSGVLYQRVNELERRQYQMQGMESISPKVETIQQELGRLRDRLDRFLDSGTPKR